MARDVKLHGVRACLAVAERRPEDVMRAWLTPEHMAAFGALLRDLARRRRAYKVTDGAELERVSAAKHHEGVCLQVRERPLPSLADVLSSLPAGASARLVFLDGVSNPHNVGAILRVCAHFGATALVGREGELPALSGALCRVAEGGAEHVPMVSVPDAQSALGTLERAGIIALATAADAAEVALERGAGPAHPATAQGGSGLPARAIFLLGAEREGLGPELRALAARALRIPGTGWVESLNVSAACAVLLAEHARQHGLGVDGG